jgi:hypothetical protein
MYTKRNDGYISFLKVWFVEFMYQRGSSRSPLSRPAGIVVPSRVSAITEIPNFVLNAPPHHLKLVERVCVTVKEGTPERRPAVGTVSPGLDAAIFQAQDRRDRRSALSGSGPQSSMINRRVRSSVSSA